MSRNGQRKPRSVRSRTHARRTTASEHQAARKKESERNRKPRRFLPSFDTAGGDPSSRPAAVVAGRERWSPTTTNRESSVEAHAVSRPSDSVAPPKIFVPDVPAFAPWPRDRVWEAIRDALVGCQPQMLELDNMYPRRRQGRGKVERGFKFVLEHMLREPSVEGDGA